MRVVELIMGRIFGDLDRQIGSLQEIRDSFHRANVEIYGEELAGLLNEW